MHLLFFSFSFLTQEHFVNSTINQQRTNNEENTRINNEMKLILFDEQVEVTPVTVDGGENGDKKYISNSFQSRHLLDIYADSLLYVNKLYNKKFTTQPRKVPGHMAHMIDQSIMRSMINEFSNEFTATSSNKFRTSTDMQFAFSYFYYLINEKKQFNVTRILTSFDTDLSG